VPGSSVWATTVCRLILLLPTAKFALGVLAIGKHIRVALNANVLTAGPRVKGRRGVAEDPFIDRRYR